MVLVSKSLTGKFQFLIGRLQTVRAITLHVGDVWFQFLIGRLQTLQHCPYSCHIKMFQFLIGRLQTSLGKFILVAGRGFNSS